MQGDRLIAESAPGHYRSYAYEPGTFRPLALLQGEGQQAQPCYYQLDHLGTPQELTSPGGAILWSVKYRANGNVAQVEIADIDNPLRFQGQYFDAETGLHYNRHRYYNPNTGCFLTPDPIKLAGGLNNYQYVNNPTGWVDPLGLNSQCPPGNGKANNIERPENQAKVDEGEPNAPYAGPLPKAVQEKILYGTRSPGHNKPIGGHSPKVLNSQNYQYDIVQVNPDGTISAKNFKMILERKDGTVGWSAQKSPNRHTFAPKTWSDEKILRATDEVAESPGVVLRDSDGIKVTQHTKIVDGVEWQVIKENDVVTSSYPTGGTQ